MSTGIVTAYALYLREGPDRNQPILGALYKDDIVTILDNSPDKLWKKLRTANGTEGWSSAKYLRIESSDTPPPIPSTGQYLVTAYALYIREGAGSSYKALGYLRYDDIVESLGESADGKWKQVQRADGLTGWASSKYLQSINIVVEPPPSESAQGRYQVTAYALYVREGAARTFKAITYLREGDVVTALNLSSDGLWLEVRLSNGLIGWVSKKYLQSLGDPAPPFEPAPASGQYRVSIDSLYLRAGAGTDSPSIGLMQKDTLLTALSTSSDGSWKEVQLESGQTGWCAGKYLYCLSGVESPAEETDLLGFHRNLSNVLSFYIDPDPETQLIGELSWEETVDVLEVSADKKWKKIVTAYGKVGWSEIKYLVSLGECATLKDDEEFPWMPIAFNDLGLREFAGSPSNPQILEYMASTNLREFPHLPDETDWCAAFVNWNIEQAGIEATGWATVYPWMAWGDEIKTPRRGCVVNFQWDDGGQHTAFYLGECGDRVRALGGNQSKAVWIKSYPKRNVINYRIPKNWG
ncbi:MAG: TIGR02594 family protein [Deltaproteobacteria bacterium]|nr:TIGR02594 family protein [Deltaproteobacteria bacterium]